MMIRVHFDNETCAECETLDGVVDEILHMVGEAWPIRIFDTRTGEIFAPSWRIDLDLVDSDTPEEFQCAGCEKWLPEEEVNWARDDGILTTINGKPWCDECLPPECDEKVRVLAAVQEYQQTLQIGVPGTMNDTEKRKLADSLYTKLKTILQPEQAGVSVVCENPDCPKHGEVINEVTILPATAVVKDAIGLFLENFGHNPDSADFCPECKKLGVASETPAACPEKQEMDAKEWTNPHDPKNCTFKGYGQCPGCDTDYYIESGERKSSRVDPKKFGPHEYDAHGTVDCKHGCGCWVGPNKSGGPVNPFGPCPENPIKANCRLCGQEAGHKGECMISLDKIMPRGLEPGD